jgi:Ankyrin repeats (3 copies)
MSISKLIIYGEDDELVHALRAEMPLDEVDEYGYTPLIQAAIVNSVSKTQLLLDAGADPNFTDLTGRSALHWAADNNNLELAQLLLERGANANAYTRAGQPVLAMPLLRDYQNIKYLLYRYDASLDFAQDFINAKVLGHRFELEGRIDIVDTENTFIEVEFEGFYLEFSLEIALTSLRDFIHNFGAKHLRPYFSQFEAIIQSLSTAVELMKYQHYLVDAEQHQKVIDKLLTQKPLIIPISFEGHAITLIRMGSHLIRCDRGEFGRDHGTVIIYRMGKKHLFNKRFIKTIMYKRQSRDFIDNGLVQMLQLEVADVLTMPTQLSGNCSWANVEAILPALLYYFALDAAFQQDRPIDRAGAANTAMKLYDEWLQWDRNRALYFCLQSFSGASPARKAAKAAILAAIIYQRCDYAEIRDLKTADKILSILTQEEYIDLLKIYVKVFRDDKTSNRLKNLAEFLDHAGYDIEKLTR